VFGQVRKMSGICQDCGIASRGDYNTQMSRRPLVIISLLLACLGLIGLLGWQSWQLQQSNDAAARAVQRDYANLAADEFGRRITSALGYRGYFQVISSLDNPTSADDIRAAMQLDDRITLAAELVDGVFVADPGRISTDGFSMTNAMGDLIAGIVNDDGETQGPYQSVAATPATPQVIFTRSDNDESVFGFTVASSGVTKYLQEAFATGPLLPASLGNGKVGNDQVYLEVRDAAGNVVLATNSMFPYAEVVEKTMGADYQGVVEGFTLRAAVNPSQAGMLVIGGLPADRLPLLVVVMILAIALLLTAIWLFRREHELMRLRVDFVSQVSHELRTPLTQIRMFAETLLLKRARSDEEQHRALQIIDRESRRLSHLVENILQYSNISDSLRVNPELQPVAPVLREICDAIRLMNSDCNIQLNVADSVLAEFDDDALRQILLNLLDNAVKYGPKGQEILVNVSAHEHAVQIEVVDQGPGIPAAEQERVWGAFYRLAREQQTAVSGAGIGLAVVRELVEAMGGNCWIAEAEAGSRIVVELPGAATDVG
jgi:signal transduction histidine kinase